MQSLETCFMGSVFLCNVTIFFMSVNWTYSMLAA